MSLALVLPFEIAISPTRSSAWNAKKNADMNINFASNELLQIKWSCNITEFGISMAIGSRVSWC